MCFRWFRYVGFNVHVVAFKTSTTTLYRDRKESKKALWGPKNHDFGGNALEIVFDDMANKIVHMGLQKGMVVPKFRYDVYLLQSR